MITEENVTSNDTNDNQEVQETQPQVENNQTQEQKSSIIGKLETNE